MTLFEAGQVVQFFLVLGFFALAYFFLYRRTRCDQFREDLFTIRDNLFDFMWQNDLSYDMRAYVMLRESINGMILGAHIISFPFLLVTLPLSKRKAKALDIRPLIAEIADERIRDHFDRVYKTVGRRVLDYIFLEGILWFLFKPVELLVRKWPTQRHTRHGGGIMSPSLPRNIRDALVNEFVVLGKPGSPEARQLTRLSPQQCR